MIPLNMDVTEAASQIANAVKIVMDPSTPAQQREEANKLCDEFKFSSISVPCGLLLSSKDNDNIIRHFGLQLIEHNIKFKWNNMKQREKVFLKSKVFEILSSDTKGILEEPLYIKSAFSRIVVEMIKREWPQQWPDMLREFNDLCIKGETQLDLVLLIFLNLAEDVALLQIVPTRRRREIYQALTVNLTEIFAFFMKTLNDCYQQHLFLRNSDGELEKQKASINCHLSNTVLKTFCGFLEWVPWSNITADNNMLLQILCKLLGDPAVRLAAVECLLQIVTRKGRVDERTPLLTLFSDDAVGIFLSSASSASAVFENEENYLYLKKLCEVLVNMGTQLAALWTDEKDSKEPSTLKIYLNIMLTFTRHPSLVISELTISLWICFLNHPIISSNSSVSDLILDIAGTILEKMTKPGRLSDGSTSSEFAQLEFNSDEELNSFYLKFRSEAVPIWRYCAKLQSADIFNYGAKLLLKLLESFSNGHIDEKFPDQLDAVATYLDCVCCCLYAEDKLKLCGDGPELLKFVLQFEIQDPVSLSPLLSCMSAMFVFLTLAPELTPTLLNRLFYAAFLQYPNRNIGSNARGEKIVRKHASACIIKMCKEHPKLLLPAFEEMYALVKQWGNNEEKQFPAEKCHILESLIIISNEFCDFEKQSTFIGEIIAKSKDMWPKCIQYMSSPDCFINAVGLCDPCVQNEVTDLKTHNIFQITHNISFICAVVRRCKWPSDPDIAEKGKFVVKNSTVSYLRNPALNHILPLLDGVFAFIRCINSLFVPSIRQTLHTDYANVLDITDSERQSILGFSEKSFLIADEPGVDSPVSSLHTRMKNFLFYQYEACLILLGNASQYFVHEFYSMPGLTKSIKNCVFAFLGHLPDFRLRMMLHYFLIPFFRHCVPESQHVIIEILEVLAPFMFEKLSTLWNRVQQLNLNNAPDGSGLEETKEILEDRLCRLLTKEYIDVLYSAMRAGKSVDPTVSEMEDDEQKPASNSCGKLSTLGLNILRSEVLRPYIVCIFFEALRWPDTAVSNKSALFCPIIFKALHDEKHIGEQEAVFMLKNVLTGLSVLGEHEINQNSLLLLGLQIYEAIRPICQAIGSTLMDFCGCSVHNLDKFDQMLSQQRKENEKGSERKKKEAFKTLVAEVIGKSVGQLHKNKIKIQNLPPLLKPLKINTNILDDAEVDNVGLCSLFSS